MNILVQIVLGLMITHSIFSYYSYAQPTDLAVEIDPLIAMMQSVGAHITITLAGTLADLALASAGFLLSTRSQMKKNFDEKQEQISQEKNSERKSHL